MSTFVQEQEIIPTLDDVLLYFPEGIGKLL